MDLNLLKFNYLCPVNIKTLKAYFYLVVLKIDEISSLLNCIIYLECKRIAADFVAVEDSMDFVAAFGFVVHSTDLASAELACTCIVAVGFAKIRTF